MMDHLDNLVLLVPSEFLVQVDLLDLLVMMALQVMKVL